MAPSKRSRRPYHHGNLRRALLDEALVIIGAEGVDALTLREIGARVGVSRTALYRHFADKPALLAAVATEGFRMLRERLAGAWEEAGRGRAGFRAMGVAYIGFAMENPAHYRVMFGRFDRSRPDAELEAEGAAAFGVLVDAVAALQGSGMLAADDTLQMAQFVWALVHGVAMLAIDGALHEPGTVEELGRYALERLESGIARRP
jgi:AcrR family transcriptional regulator